MDVIDSWITRREAAELLGVKKGWIAELGKTGRLPCKTFEDKTNATTYYSYRAVMELRHTSARAKRRRGASCLPLPKTEGENWITYAQAAAILGVGVPAVRRFAATGWFEVRRSSDQKWARQYVAQTQVEALLRNEEWRANRDRAFPSYYKIRRVITQATEEERAEAPEWLNPKQAAFYLGITRKCVCYYRRKGRITGRRVPPGNGSRQALWQFHRDELQRLLDDPQFQRKRQTYQESYTEALQQQRMVEREARAIEQMRRVQGHDRCDYKPFYQASPGDVW